jgi:hypothetical protein
MRQYKFYQILTSERLEHVLRLLFWHVDFK